MSSVYIYPQSRRKMRVGEDISRMTRSERLVVERMLGELETEMRKVQEEMNELRRQLKATYTSRRRARERVCQRERRALQLCKPDRVDGR